MQWTRPGAGLPGSLFMPHRRTCAPPRNATNALRQGAHARPRRPARDNARAIEACSEVATTESKFAVVVRDCFSDHKCDGNDTQDTSCQHQKLNNVKARNNLHGHLPSARHPTVSVVDERRLNYALLEAFGVQIGYRAGAKPQRSTSMK
jgi:hypothetical protein